MSDITSLRLVLKYLKHNNFIDSFLTFEKQSKIEYENFSKEILFLRKIILQGQFNEAIHFIQQFQQNIEDKDLKKIYFEIYKQKFYELIQNPNQLELKQLLQKEIVNYCQEEEFHSLLQFLELKNIQQHPLFQTWTILRGRMNCFESIRQYVQILQSNVHLNNQTIEPSLEQIIKFYYSNKQQNKQKVKIIVKSNENEVKNSNNVSDLYNVNTKKSGNTKNKYSYIQNLKLNQVGNMVLNNKPQNKQQNYLEISENKSEKNDFGQNNSIKSFKNNKTNINLDTSSLNKNYNPQQNYFKQKDSFVFHNQNSNDNFTFSQNQKIPFKKKLPKIPEIRHLATIKDNKAIRVSRFSADYKYLALGTLGSAIKIFDIQKIYSQNKKKLIQLNPIYEISNLHQKSVFFIDWSKKQNRIISCSNDNTIKLTKIQPNFSKFSINLIGKHQAPVRMVKFNFAENNVISCSQDSTIRVWDVQRAKNTGVFKGHQYTVNSIKLLDKQNDQILLSSGRDYTVRLWDMRTGDCQLISKQFDSELTYIADNTQDIVVSHKNGRISFLDKQLRLKENIEIHTDQIRSIQGNELQRSYLTSSFDGRVCLLSSNQKNELSKTYVQHNKTDQDGVVYATFYKQTGIVSCSKLGICNLYSLN